ncbi:MAG: protein kinase [Pseudomonadota bacterium]
MDTVRAKIIAKELNGNKVGDWTVTGYINNGKSAVVLKAHRDKEEAALKVFDPELIEKYGKKTQLIRIERELKLIGKKHPNLIEIKDGGECKNSGFLYVAMAYIPWNNLSQLASKFPRDKIVSTIKQLAKAAKFLEEMDLAHRDIKPENIILSKDFSTAILLDLGVLKPFELSEITDGDEQKVFVGTLRYSPPELLFRTEEDSEEGWRAVTFYQLGAILHDIIMRRELFHYINGPYAALVEAVKSDVPEIYAEDVDSDLLILARGCLVKNPVDRVTMTKWDHFFKPIKKVNSVDSIKNRIDRRTELFRKYKENNDDENIDLLQFRKLENITYQIKNLIRNICINDKKYFPRFEINHKLSQDNREARINICFNPSNYPRLLCNGTLFFIISLSNLPDEITKITFIAFASNKSISDMPLESYPSYQLYMGRYDENIINSHLTFILFSFIDRCQECQKPHDDAPVLLEIPLEE